MQIRLTLSNALHQYLQQQSKLYGLTMAGYVKNLIIQDIKGVSRPISQARVQIDESVKKKKRI